MSAQCFLTVTLLINLPLYLTMKMKKNVFLALLLGAVSFSAAAQGYKDGIDYYKAGQYSNAITLLDRNLNDPSTDKALAYYYLGQSYLGLSDDVAKAKQYFDMGVQADEKCPYNYVGLGALALRNKDNDTAKDMFKKAQSLGKKNYEILVDIARAYYDADPVAFAKEIDKYITKAKKDSKFTEASIYVFEGDRKFHQKDYNGAATDYGQAIEFDVDNPEGYVKYANTYFYVVPEYAIQKLQELLQRHPESALAQRELAEKYYRNDQWTLAARQYGEYMKNPNHFPEDKARYAVLLYAGEQYEKSLETANEVLAGDPNDVTLNRIVILNLSKLNRRAEALEKAKAFFHNPVVQESLNAADYRNYGSLLTENNQDSLALNVFNMALSKYPDDALLNQEVSDWYFKNKDYVKAAEYYGKYLDNNKNARRNDMYAGARLYRYAAIVKLNEKDTTAAIDLAKQGVKYMDMALDGVEPPHQYLHRRAQLELISNNNVPTDKMAQDFEAEIALLNQDPSKADPNAKPNYLSEYVEAYNALALYYSNKGDSAKAEECKTQAEKYNAIRNSVSK